MAATGQNGARQNFNESGTCRAVVNKYMEKHLRQNMTLQACSKDPRVFVAEKQAQGNEGRRGKIEKTN